MTAADKEKLWALVLAEAEPRFVFREYGIETRGGSVCFPDGTAFKSASLAELLDGCPRCAVIAATLGHGTDRAIRRLQFCDLASAYLYDACANAYIEEVCDGVEERIAKAALKAGFTITKRFSPGYGDFALEDQAAVLRLTGAAAGTGICLSAGNLLIPQKSVTAVIGYKKTV